MFLFEEHIVK